MANSKDFIVKNGIQAGANSNITGTLAVGNTSITGTLAAGNTSITGTLASGNTTIAGNLTFSTITAGTWNGSVITGQYGGTGVNNSGKTVTLGGNITTANSLTTSGNFATTLTATAATNVTLPTTGTLATLAGSETLTNKTLTSPTISGGALSGTFTGSPLFSGFLTTNNYITVNMPDYTNNDGLRIQSGTPVVGNPAMFFKKSGATNFGIVSWNGTSNEGSLTLTFPAGITASANLSVGSVLSVTGNTSIGGNLTVTGNLTISKNYSPNATRYGILNTLTLDNSESLSGSQTGYATLNDIIADTQNSSIDSQYIIGALNRARSGTLGGSSNSSLNLYYGARNIASANTSDPVYKYTQQVTGSENIARIGGNTAIVNALYGIIASARVEVDGGSAGNAIGVMSNPGTTTTGSTVTNAYAFVANFSTSGTITNKYGLYINDNTAHNIIAGGLQVGGPAVTGTSLGGVGVGVVSPGAGMIQTSNNVIIGGNLSVNGAITAVNLTLSGNLTINGTTTTVNSTTVTIDDPILTLGGDTAPTLDDNKDRGIEFRWHNGTSAKSGFFGYDDSTGYFTFIPDATNTSEVFSGTKGILDATALLANNASYLGGTIASGYQTTAGLSANVATLTANNAAYLGGTIASGYQTTAGLSANVATLTANNASYLGGTIASGYQTTAGLSASVATLTANNSTYLNGQLASYYTNATNISTGTLAVARGGTGVTTSTGSGSVVLSAGPTFTGNTTFDTDTLFVDGTNGRVGVGTITPTTPLHVASTVLADLIDTVRISHTNSGATYGPALVIQRDSASPANNDALGIVTFRGNNSAANPKDYAWIQSYIVDNTATTEDGALALAVSKNGVYIEVLTVSNTGIDVTGNVVSSAQITGNYTALANGTTAMALATNHVVKVTPTATATFTTTVAAAGSRASIIILTSGASSYTITFGSGFKTTGTLATGTTTAKTFVVDFVSDGTSMIEVSRTTAM